MTKWSPIPTRPVGAPWQGMDTKGGKLDDGTGKQNENSFNVQINQMDRLEKRKGFVRGLAERFGTVVCGLHTYVDNCGQEWLLVASDIEIAIRQPFNVPVFENDDSYPTDDFTSETGLSTTNWRNTSIYIGTGGALQRVSGNNFDPFEAAGYLRWFKEAASLAYQVTIQYVFDASSTTQQLASISIKGSGDLTTGRRLQADVIYLSTGVYIARLYKTTPDGGLVLLGNVDIVGSLTDPTGFMKLSYTRTLVSGVASFTPKIEITPSGGGLQTVEGPSLIEIEDLELGGISAIGCTQLCSILQVTGGPV